MACPVHRHLRHRRAVCRRADPFPHLRALRVGERAERGPHEAEGRPRPGVEHQVEVVTMPETSTSSTSAPRSARARATPRPMPRAAPVTTADLPASASDRAYIGGLTISCGPILR